MYHPRARLMHAATLIAIVSLAAVSAEGQAPAAKERPWTPSRTASGDPDLQGVWNYAFGTPLERPAEFAGKATLNDEELAREESRVRERGNGDRRDDGRADLDLNREHNEFWFSRRTRVLTRRTSLITDPADGKLPPLTPDAVRAQAARATVRRVRGPADSWEDRSLNERCLVSSPCLRFTRRRGQGSGSSSPASTKFRRRERRSCMPGPVTS